MDKTVKLYKYQLKLILFILISQGQILEFFKKYNIKKFVRSILSNIYVRRFSKKGWD